MEFLAVALGGAAGSVSRHALQLACKAWLGSAFPFGTLAANLSGSLLIGLCAAAAERGWPALRPWVMIGFLGGFTTFSAFSLENLQFLREGRFGLLCVNVGLSVGAGLVLAYAGYAWGRSWGG